MLERPLAGLVALPLAAALLVAVVPASGSESLRPATASSIAPSQVFGAGVPRGDVPAVDPARRGPYLTSRFEVLRGWESVDVGLGADVEDLVEVTYPTALRSGARADGAFPVVVLLHGRHTWCAMQGPVRPDPVPTWCQSGWFAGTHPVPSYQGYRYLADRLASQGRIVVSISANGINAQDDFGDFGMTARGRLVVHHLRALAAAGKGRSPGFGDRLIGRVDLSRTVLMGHSRGGEGVVRAAALMSAVKRPVATIAAVVPFAPVNFSRTPPGAMPIVTLLPACDGDVSDLQGQTFTDRARDIYGDRGGLKSSVWFAGGNHNYLNTEWTPELSASGTGSDDAAYIYGTEAAPREDAGSCAFAERLTPAQERTIGLAYLAAAVRYAQDGDARMVSLLDGSGALPATVLRAGLAVRTSSLAGPDRLLVVPTAGTRLAGVARLCRGVALQTGAEAEADACGSGVAAPGQDTAWLGQSDVRRTLPGRPAVHLEWDSPARGGAWLPRPVDLTSSDRVAVRVVLDPGTRGPVRVWLQDATGASAVVDSAGPTPAALSTGSAALRLVPQTLWVDPSEVAGIDVAAVTTIGLDVSGEGQAWILDVSARDPGGTRGAVDVAAASVPEATVVRIPAGATREVRIPVTLDRPATETVTLLARTKGGAPNGGIESRLVRVRIPAGARTAAVPVIVSMPRVVGPDDQFGLSILLYSVRGAAVGQWSGIAQFIPEGVRIRTLEVARQNVAARPGTAIVWRWRTSDGISRGVNMAFELVDAAMDYSDLDPAFRERYYLPDSGAVGPESWAVFPGPRAVRPGVLELRIPLAAGATPGAWLTMAVSGSVGAVLEPDSGMVTGVVRVPAPPT